MQTMTRIPTQAVPQSEKTEQWFKDTIDAYIGIANINPANRNRRRHLYEMYEAYNGVIDDDYYTHVTRPYGKKRGNFPAKLHRYNIVKPLIDQLVGEKSKRPINYYVTVTNPDVYNRKIQEKQELLRSLLEQEYIDIMQQNQVDPSQDSERGQDLEEIMERFDVEYNDERAISGQQALDYIYSYNEMYHKLQEGWKDFLVCGEVYSERTVESNEPSYRILNPMDIDFDMDPDLEFVEDGEWALIRQYMHVSSVIDIYYDELTKAEIVELEEGTRHPNSDFYWDSRRFQDRDIQRDRTVEVIKVYWKSRKKIGFVQWMEDGELLEKQVEEGYKVDKELGEEVEWVWVNEVMQGHRINGNLYKRMKSVDVQRGSMDNPSKCKLPINGRMYSNRNAENISLLAMMLPYQISYDIYKYRMEVSIAKSKDVIAQLDIDSIPDKPGWNMDKFLYYMDATGIMWTQSNKEGYTPNAAHKSVIDLTVRTIESYIGLLNSIVEEMERTVGISRQRQGQLSPYDGKGTTEQSIIQSSHITEDYFRKFAWFEQRDFQAMLDYSKPAWILGKKASYFMDDSGMEIIALDGIEHASTEYAVFVTDARKEREKVEAARALAQPMIQGGVRPSTVLKMYESDHFATIRKKMKEAEEIQARLEEAQAEAQQAAAQANVQLELEKMEIETMNLEKELANNLDVERIKAETKQLDAQTRKEVESIKEASKRQIEESKRRLEERKLMVEKALRREELAIKKRTEARSKQ